MDTLVVATPSRGLVHSRTVEAVLAAVQAAPVRLVGWVFSHDLPIPACHEQVCGLAVATGAECVWLVEEDVVPPVDALGVMLQVMRESDADGAFIDYPIGSGPTCNCAQVVNGTVIWCGTGCLLLRREALERIPRPWFDNRNEVEVKVRGDQVTVREFPVAYTYGGQDIGFTLRAHAAGVKIAYVPPEVAFCQHLKVGAWGKPMSNYGSHQIVALPYPERWHDAS